MRIIDQIFEELSTVTKVRSRREKMLRGIVEYAIEFLKHPDFDTTVLSNNLIMLLADTEDCYKEVPLPQCIIEKEESNAD